MRRFVIVGCALSYLKSDSFGKLIFDNYGIILVGNGCIFVFTYGNGTDVLCIFGFTRGVYEVVIIGFQIERSKIKLIGSNLEHIDVFSIYNKSTAYDFGSFSVNESVYRLIAHDAEKYQILRGKRGEIGHIVALNDIAVRTQTLNRNVSGFLGYFQGIGYRSPIASVFKRITVFGFGFQSNSVSTRAFDCRRRKALRSGNRRNGIRISQQIGFRTRKAEFGFTYFCYGQRYRFAVNVRHVSGLVAVKRKYGIVKRCRGYNNRTCGRSCKVMV